MAATIPDIIVSSDDWTDMNTASGIAAGTAMLLMNKSPVYLFVQESPTKPASDSKDGVVSTHLNDPWARTDVQAGSDIIWMRVSNEGRTARINVQDAS